VRFGHLLLSIPASLAGHAVIVAILLALLAPSHGGDALLVDLTEFTEIARVEPQTIQAASRPAAPKAPASKRMRPAPLPADDAQAPARPEPTVREQIQSEQRELTPPPPATPPPEPPTPVAQPPQQPVPAITAAPPNPSIEPQAPAPDSPQPATPASVPTSTESPLAAPDSSAMPRSAGEQVAVSASPLPAPSPAPGREAVTTARGQSSNPEAEYRAYLALVRQRILGALQYPAGARQQGLTGTVYLEILVQPSGAISDVKIISTSSHAVLDKAALEAVRTVPPIGFPPGLAPRALRARIPVVFNLR
jgi:protein TonB